MMMPFGTYENARRVGGAATEAARASAGTMASSIGRARVAPMPRRNVRRGKCFPVIRFMIRSASPFYSFTLVMDQRSGTGIRGPGRGRDRFLVFVLRRRRRILLHLERHAVHNAENQRAKPVVIRRHLPGNGLHRRPVKTL